MRRVGGAFAVNSRGLLFLVASDGASLQAMRGIKEISGLGRSQKKEIASPPTPIPLPGRLPWIGEPGRAQPMEIAEEADTTETNTHIQCWGGQQA